MAKTKFKVGDIIYLKWIDSYAYIVTIEINSTFEHIYNIVDLKNKPAPTTPFTQSHLEKVGAKVPPDEAKMLELLYG